MAAGGPALQKLSRELHTLLTAAGTPPYRALTRAVSGEISDSTLSDWFNGKSAPSRSKTPHFLALIRHLNRLASGRSSGHPARSDGLWGMLLEEAQIEGAQSRGGRPKNPRQPAGPRRRRASSSPGQGMNDPLISHKAWVEQLLRPAALFDRAAELRELDAFCTARDSADQPAYVWWQAEPWAGKTALMAEFVTRTRPTGVEVVSYFIGDRFGNNDRDAFLHEVGTQLAVVADWDTPASGTRPEAFPALCQAAVKACRRRDHRLVLVVDGLDEDTGAGPGGHSIASLLPKTPPTGMRLVVTGRPNPPVPDGVPDDHPLHDPSIIRNLIPSAYSRDISRTASRELLRLLDDEPVGEAILGLLTAARGALTERDLAELINVRLRDVGKRLRGLAGRSFLAAQTGHFPELETQSESLAYVLGHQELRQQALAGLGDAAVAGYEAMLHAWAEEYRAKGWPASTPLYLLNDYTRTLRDMGSTKRLLSFVLDPRRQLALLTGSSVDTALAEVERARQTVEAEAPGNLVALAGLAASREMIYETARTLPPSIPAAFARLGHPQRATELARAGRYPADKAIRLAKVARVLAGTGDANATDVAWEAARWAERARLESAPPNGDEFDAALAVGEAAVALVAVGQNREGQGLLALLPHAASSEDPTLTCTKTAEASLAARPRNPDAAETLLDQAERDANALASSMPADPAAPVTAWTAVARAAGPARASRMYQRISDYAQASPDSLEGGSYVGAIAASALASDPTAAYRNEAAALAQQAGARLSAAMAAPAALPKNDAATLTMLLGTILATVVQALVDTGSAVAAAELISAVPDTMRTGWLGEDARAGAWAVISDASAQGGGQSADTLAREACDLADQGKSEDARTRLREALSVFAASPGAGRRSRETWLPILCGALATSGRSDDGERLARNLRDPVQRVLALAALAAAADHRMPALRLAHEAANRARRLEGADDFSVLNGAPGYLVMTANIAAAQALARAGDNQAALSLAEEISRQKHSRSGQAHIAVAAALRTRAPASAAQVVERELERVLAKTAVGRPSRVVRLAELIAAIGNAQPECGERLHRTFERVWTEERRAEIRAETEDILVAIILASGAQPDIARRQLRRQTERTASVPPWEEPTTGLAVAQAAFGDYQTALLVANRHQNPADRAETLAAVAAYLTGTPASIQPTSDSDDTFTWTLTTLALSAMPPTTAEAATTARQFLAASLASDGWHHTLPVLALIAPEAVQRVAEIVLTHRHP